MSHNLIAFDIDSTLAESKQPIHSDMAALLVELLHTHRVAIVSGATFDRITHQILQYLPAEANLANLFLLSTCGSELWHFDDGNWTTVYRKPLTEEEQNRIIAEVTRATASIQPERVYGPQIEDRGSQVSWSALGQDAPLEVKSVWDPDKSKRMAIIDDMRANLAGFDVEIGGSNTIDITRAGINKGWGLTQLCEYLHIDKSDVLYVGDELEPGGNDSTVPDAGFTAHVTSGPDETRQIIAEILQEK